jgi:hypothetical protein
VKATSRAAAGLLLILLAACSSQSAVAPASPAAGLGLSPKCAAAAAAFGVFLDDVSTNVHAFLDGETTEGEYRAWEDASPNGTYAFGIAFDACEAGGEADVDAFRVILNAPYGGAQADTTDSLFGDANAARVQVINYLDGYATKQEVMADLAALDTARGVYNNALAGE